MIVGYKDGKPLSCATINYGGFYANGYEFADSENLKKLLPFEQGAKPVDNVVAFTHDPWPDDAAELYYLNIPRPFCCEKKILVYTQLHFYP